MTEPVTSQVMVFLFTILTGVLAGLLYDFYAGIGYVWRLRKTGIFLGDVIFWVILTILVYSLILYYNQGEVRFFVFLGLVIGAFLYFQISRKRVRMAIVKLINLIIRLLKAAGSLVIWLIGIIFLPVRFLYSIFTYPIRLLKTLLSKVLMAVLNLGKRLVPTPLKNLYHRLINSWRKLKEKIKHIITWRPWSR